MSGRDIFRIESMEPVERAYAEAMHENCDEQPEHPLSDHSPWTGSDLDGVMQWSEFTARLARHGLTLTLDAARAAAPPVGPRITEDLDIVWEDQDGNPASPDPAAGLRDWAAARRGVADRWAKVADSYGKPASAVEVAAAVRYDDGYDLNNPNLPERYHRLLYDRRALLNVIAALLDSGEQDGLDDKLVRHLTTWIMKSGWVRDYEHARAESEGFAAEYARLSGDKP